MAAIKGTHAAMSRRQLLAFAPMATLAACGGRLATGYPGFALITLGGENTVAIVDLTTFHLVGKREFRSAPSMVVSRRGTAYALTPANGTVHVVDPKRPSDRRSVRLATSVDLLCLSQTGQLVAASSAERELILVDTDRLRPRRHTRLFAVPRDLDVRAHSLSRRTYAALSGGSTGMVETVDLETGTQRKRELDGDLGTVRFRDDGQLLFVASYGRQSLIVLDTETLETVCELPLPMKPENLAFGADNGQLFVSGPGMDGISIVYVYKTLEVDQTVLAAKEPGCMACSSTPRYLFVASRAGSEVAILNVDSRKMVALSLSGDRVSRILITPDQQYALVLNQGGGDLAIIRIPEIRNGHTRRGASSLPSAILTLRGVSLFAMIPLGESPADIALADQT